MNFKRVTKRNKCQLCGSPDWCGISADGAIAICMRTQSPKLAKNGGWVHILIENSERKPIPVMPPKPEPYRPGAKHLDAVYNAFLEGCVLSYSHELNLITRGIRDYMIHIHGYKSMPAGKHANEAAESLSKEFSLEAVPGFYQENKRWKFRTYNASGYLVPIRNHEHKITALTLRRDDNKSPKYLLVSSANLPRGASSGVPHHFAMLGKVIKRKEVTEIVITEGALKANVAAEFIDIPVIGLVSITTFDDSFPVLLKEVFPNLELAKIAFDMEIFDPERPDKCAFTHVNRQRKRLVDTLGKLKIKSSVLSWNPSLGKGLDDYLLQQSQKLAA